MIPLTLDQVAVEVAALRAALAHEADASPGGHLIYTRPHETARYRYQPRHTTWGTRAPGRSRIIPDCPRPVRGRCECAPDGAWRLGGSRKPDEVVGLAVWTGERWEDYFYYLDREDGYWRCSRPHARAIQRLRSRSPRKFTALARLLEGESSAQAWGDLGKYQDPDDASLRTLAQVRRMAEEEARAEYVRPPRRPRRPKSTTGKSTGDLPVAQRVG